MVEISGFLTNLTGFVNSSPLVSVIGDFAQGGLALFVQIQVGVLLAVIPVRRYRRKLARKRPPQS